jgi:hypothetical protein
MAFPIIEGTPWTDSSAGGTSHVITFDPATIENELLIGLVAGYDHIWIASSSSSIWCPYVYHGAGDNLHCAIIQAKRSAGYGNDYITFSTSGSIILRWVIFRITGHGVYDYTDIGSSIGATDTTTNFQVNQCPHIDDDISADYKWLTLAAYAGSTPITLTSGNKTEKLGATASVCLYEEDIATDLTAQTNFNTAGLNCNYFTWRLRMPPGPLPLADDPALGFGIYVANSAIGIET